MLNFAKDKRPKNLQWEREVVLPDGSFASIGRPLTTQDFFVWKSIAIKEGVPDYLFLGVASDIILIDGEAVSFETLMNMEYALFRPIEKMLHDYIQDIIGEEHA